MDGVYRGYIDTIFIQGDSFCIHTITPIPDIPITAILPPRWGMSYGNNVLAEGHIKYIDSNVAVVNSTDVPSLLFKNTQIEYLEKTDVEDFTIYFNFPNLHSDCIVLCDFASLGTQEAYYDSNEIKFTFHINGETNMCDSTIKVKVIPPLYTPVNPNDNNYFLSEYDWANTLDYSISNNIRITMPYVCNNIFGRWYFDNAIIECYSKKEFYFLGRKYHRISKKPELYL